VRPGRLHQHVSVQPQQRRGPPTPSASVARVPTASRRTPATPPRRIRRIPASLATPTGARLPRGSRAGSHTDERPLRFSGLPQATEKKFARGHGLIWTNPDTGTGIYGPARLGVRVRPSAPGQRPLPTLERPFLVPTLLPKPLTSVPAAPVACDRGDEAVRVVDADDQ
jgi:hypothetical protein